MVRLRLSAALLRGRYLAVATSVAAVAVATAGVCAVEIVSHAVLEEFVRAAGTVAGPSVLEVRSRDGAPLRLGLAARLADVPGVAATVPIAALTLRTAEDDPESLAAVGVELGRPDVLRLLSPGADNGDVDRLVLATRADAIVVTPGFAQRRSLSVGSTLRLDTPVGRRAFVVGGVVEPAGAPRALGDGVVVLPLHSAQALLGHPGRVSRIDVVVGQAEDPGSVRDALAARLPADVEVVAPPRLHDDVQRAARSLGAMLRGAAAIGVGLSFLVAYNRLATHFASRMWEVSLLRAVGVRARTTWLVLLGESALLGMVGVLVGIPLGFVGGRFLLPAIEETASIGYRLPMSHAPAAAGPWSAVIAGAVGLVAAMAAAALPAWRAAGAPVAGALRRRGRDEAHSRNTAGWRLGSVLPAVVATAATPAYVAQSTAWGILATAAVVLAAALTARPMLALLRLQPLATMLARASPCAMFAREGIVRSGRRSAMTVATIGVGLGCVVWMSTLTQSLERTLVAALRGTLRAELIVMSPERESGWIPAPTDEALLAELRDVEGVRRVAGNRLVDWRHRGVSIGINAFDPAYFADPGFGRPHLVGPRAPDVWERIAAGSGVIVSTTFAERFGTRVGDDIVLESPAGPLALAVLGTTVAFVSAGGTVEMSRALYRRHWRDERVNRVWVRTAADASVETVRRAVMRSAGAARRLLVLTPGEVLDDLVSEVRRAFRPMRLAWCVVLLVLLLGMADTLLADVLARTRDIGVMRAVGARRSHVRRVVVAEALMLGGLGLLLAWGMGLGLAWLWAETTFRQLLGWQVDLHVGSLPLLGVGVTTLVVCVLAAVVPAHRASALVPVVALRSD